MSFNQTSVSEESNYLMLCVIDDKNTFDDEEDNISSGEQERQLQASRSLEKVIRAIK